MMWALHALSIARRKLSHGEVRGDSDRVAGAGWSWDVITLSEEKDEQAECESQQEATPHGLKTDGSRPMYITYTQSKIIFRIFNWRSRPAL